MARGGRRKRRGDGFLPPAHGPPRPMCPPQPAPPDMGWHGPPFPGGHPGYPDPDLTDDSVGYRPVMEPPYGPTNEPGFGPVDHDFRGRANQFHGPRPMMDVDYGPPDMGHGPVMVREYEHVDHGDLGPMPDRPMMPEPPEFRAFVPPFEERDFGPMGRECAPPMDGGYGPRHGELSPVDRNYQQTTDERSFGSAVMPMEGGFAPSSVQDQRGMFFGGPRTFHGPPDQDMAHDHGHGARMMGRPGWVDTSGMAHPGHPHPGHNPPGHPPTGHPHSGHHPPGHPHPGHHPPGHPHPGHPPTGHPPPGHPPTGHPPPGHPPTGHPPPGHPPPGHPPSGYPPPGHLPPSKKPEPQKKPKLPPKPCSKPPPGRFQGIISFIGADYGFIERDDLKKIHFSFDAFWGDTTEMIPGVRVQFTVYKDKGKECATDVVVPPGGTEEVDGDILEGVVSRAPECQVDGKSRKLTLPKYAGSIQATLPSEEAELPFTTHDYRPSLLAGDRVQFNLLTDLVTKEKRATNIALVPNTFQFTNESRETGVVMNTKDGSGSIMSEEWSNLCFDADENLSDTELRVMDEVEFTVVPTQAKEQHKAVRVRRLPEGTVTFGKKTRERIAEAMEKNSTRFSLEKGKWKAVTNEVLPQRTVVFEDISSEQYEGIVVTTPPKAADRAQGQEQAEAASGLLVATVAGADRKLPFGSGDVTSEATMMPGDRVQFNICTKRSTKAERATNIELLLNSLDHSQEQREKGVVMDLRESFGFIRCQRDPQLFFHLKEVLEESKLNLTDEVEFTVLPASAGEGNQAVRVKKLLWSAFTATPKLEALGAPSKEKKKMTIKLLRDSVNDEMKNLKVKIESFSTESATDEDPAEPMDENTSSGKQGVGDFIPPKSENDPQPVKMDGEGGGVEVKGQEKSSSSADTPKQRKDTKGESRNGAHGGGGGEENGRATRAGKYRSPHREHGKRRSRSRSRSCERGHRHERRRRRSRSRSRERGGRSGSGRRRSRSRERADSYSRGHGSRESTNRGGARRRSKSRTPERNGSSRKKVSTSDKGSSLAKDGRGGSREPLPRAYPNPATQELPRSENILDEELSRKKRELELLEEHIARRRAIIAMEQKGLAPKGQSNNEQDSESSGYFRFPLEPESADKPAPLPMKSILKKRTEPFMDFGQQGEIPKNLPLKQNFVSQSCFGPPPVELPPFLQTSDEQSYYEPPPDRSPFSQSVSQREPVHHPSHSQSAVHQPPVDQPPVCHSPPSQQAPTQSAASTQFERFLRTLNKGVDAKLLSSLVKEVREEDFAREAVEPRVPPQGEVFYKDEDRYEDSRGTTTTEEPDDFLLPHERAFRDGGGFSRIVGMKHGLQAEAEDSWREGDVEDEERFLYGERADEGERGGAAAGADRGRREPRRAEAEPKPAGEDRLPHYDKIQSLLQTIGLDLDISEVSKLTDRTQERLYGKKQKGRPPGQIDCASGRATRRSGRHRSQTDSPESDRARSVSPVSTSRREVYMSIRGVLEHSSAREQERFATGARTVRSLRKSRSPSHSTPSSSRYSRAPQEPYSQYQSAPEHELAYGQQGSATVTGWNQVPRQAEVQSPPAFSQHPGSYVDPQHPGSFVDPQHPGSYVDPQHPGSYVDTQHPGSYVDPQHPGSYVDTQHPGSYVDTQHPGSYVDPQHSVSYVDTQHPGSYIDPQHPGSYAKPQHPGSYADPQHPGSYVDPQHPGSYAKPPSPFVNVAVGPHAVSPFLPPHSLPHVTLASPVGLPAGLSSPFVGPPAVSLPSPTFSGATSYYSLHPLTGVPILAPVGGAAFPVAQPVAVGGGEVETHARELATTKSRCLRVIKTVKIHSNSPAQSSNLKEVTTTSEQSSDSALAPCPAPCGPAEKKQVTTISEDDIKAKQKKRLEQFNERMRQKKEQQKEAMRSRVKCQKVPPGKTCTEVKNVWVCGHSLVFWAEKRAKSPEYGMQLGMDPGRVRVWWKGMQGMTWDQLLPLLLQLKGSWPNPDVIILHLGGNDLGKSDLGLLLAAVKKDLASLRGIFPKCLLVWSDILPRRSWRACEDAGAMESYRALVNRRVRADLAELGGAAVTHDSIRPGSDAGLYRPDGVHLSGKGIDMFNIDLQDFLERWDGEEAEGAEPV